MLVGEQLQTNSSSDGHVSTRGTGIFDMVAVCADRGDGSCGRVGFRTGASSELLPFALILRTVIGRGVAARTGIVILAVEVVATTSVVVDDLSGRGGVAVNPGVAYRAVLSSLELGLVRQR